MMYDIIAPPEIAGSNKTALIFGDRVFTYGELRAAVDRLACGLRTFFHAGDLLAVWLPNGPELVLLMLACWRASIVPVPLHAGMKDAEVAQILAQARPMGLVAFRPLVPAVTGGIAHLFLAGETPVPTFWRPFGALLSGDRPFLPVQRDPGDLALVLHTSGSHGRPKGVMLSYSSVAHVLQCRFQRARITSASVGLVASCLTQSIGLYQVLSLLAAGGAVVLLAGYDIERLQEALLRHRPTHLHMVVDPFDRLLRHPLISADHFSSLDFVAAGGDRVTASVQNRYQELTGRYLGITYGLSEINWVMVNSGDRADKALALGVPCEDTEVEVRSATGEMTPDGEIGELFVRGPKGMLGYLNDEELSRETLLDGWLATGDLIMRDSDGYYWFKGRRKNLIVLSTGDNVSPVEIESVILDHPDVVQCVVVGISNAEGSLLPVALIVRRNRSLTERGLLSFLRERLSAFKIPRKVTFVAALPTGLTGKICRDSAGKLLDIV